MSQSLKTLILPDEAATLTFGEQLAKSIKPPFVVFLQGALGAGKTTLVRGFLKRLGYEEKIKSPTFTLVESYEFQNMTVYHFDLYRLSDPEELELMGIRDYFDDQAVAFIEWPEYGVGHLPKADLTLELKVVLEGRLLTYKDLIDK